MLYQYKTIAALTLLLSLSASANIYLAVEYVSKFFFVGSFRKSRKFYFKQIVVKEFEKCMNGELTGMTDSWNSTETFSSTESTTALTTSEKPSNSTTEVPLEPEEPLPHKNFVYRS